MMNHLKGRPDSYDRFAEVYERHWTPTSRWFTSAVAVALLPRLSPGARLLDLCCGTGVLLQELEGGGLHAVGLDGSRPMLERARRRVTGAALIQADARRFALNPVFDGVTCMFDSLNHMLTVEELKEAFGCVRDSLMRGGWFLFDLNTEAAYHEHWDGSEIILDSDMRITTSSRYQHGKRLGVFVLTIEHMAGGAVAATEKVRLTQRCHSREEVLTAMSMAGLVLVDVFSFDRGALVSVPPPDTERIFYLCRKAA